jgi:hypothetical protein
MSDNFSSVGYGPNASYGTVDTRSLEELQGGAPAASYTAAAPQGAGYGVDLRSIDEVQRGNMPATGALQQDKGNGFVSDVGVGFVRGAKNTVRGVILLGKGVFGAIAHPGETKQKIGEWGAYAVSHPGQALSRTVTLPFRMAGAMVQPYSDAIKTGRPGLAVGQLGFDALLAYGTTKAIDKVRNGSSAANGGGVGGDDAGVMNTGGGAGGKGTVKGGGAVSVVQQNKVGSIKTGAVTVKGNGNVIIIGGNNSGAISGGTSHSSQLASDLASTGDDIAGTMSKTATKKAGGGLFGFFGGNEVPKNVTRGANGRFVSLADQTMNVADDAVNSGAKQGGFLSRLFGGNGGGSATWEGTRNLASPKSTFNSIANGIDNGFNAASTVGTNVGNAFNNSMHWLDRGLSYLHPDNMMAGLQKVGNAVVSVPKFVINNPGTSIKYAVAGTATAVYTAGQVVVNSARFAVANPAQAAILVAAGGRTLGALPVRNEQRSDMTFDPDL